MYTKAVRSSIECGYTIAKGLAAQVLPWQYAHEPLRPYIASKFPGAAHESSQEQSVPTQNYDGSCSVSV
jgi:hypothetical protein